MLQVKDIKKKYITGNLEQMALDGVSLDLRDNEFVAILGPSGSGKTTLLNIIGGLDRYDSGDLIINGVTTKEYKDRDWDSYRNHTIGFVFQSYNLIPHQTVLSNVELALTISGISRDERKERAKEALKKVGLEDHIYKKPNQLSGGQMQRVAIARALVNDPDILLADEPTGALDSETSLQVMDLLKEVAKDRLVVMVTHNPELAEKYATRIVQLKDGKITADSDPFNAAAFVSGGPIHKNLGKASMSFLTALALSFNNLWTKKARTILVAFAGSIGIIGIALILSLSDGVNKYIEDTQEETLAAYPLSITKTSFDIGTMMSSMPSGYMAEGDKDVVEVKLIADMFSSMDNNDLASLKKFLEDPKSRTMEYATDIEYTYDLSPWIFRQEENKVRQVCPSSLTTEFDGEAQAYAMMGVSMEAFGQLPRDASLYRDQYDVMAGRWPENKNEAVLVLSSKGHISDNMLYVLGFRDGEEFDKLIQSFRDGNPIFNPDDVIMEFDYEDFLSVSFKVVPSHYRYKYDSNYKVWTDKADDNEYMKDVVSKGWDLNIVGVMAPKENSRVAMLYPGIMYTQDLLFDLVAEAEGSEIVKDQKKNRSRNVFTGKSFSDTSNNNAFNMESLFTVDENAFANAFNFNSNAMNMDFSGMDLSNLANNIDPSSIDLSGLDNIDFSQMMSNIDMSNLPPITMEELRKLLDGVEVDLTPAEAASVFRKVLDGYMAASGDELRTLAAEIANTIGEYFRSQEFRDLLQKEMDAWREQIVLPSVTQEDIRAMVERIMAGFSDFVQGYDPNGDKTINQYITEYLESGTAAALIQDEVDLIQQKMDELVIPAIDSNALADKVSKDYEAYAAKQGAPGINEILQSISTYLGSEEGKKLLEDSVNEVVDVPAVEKQLQKNIENLVSQYTATMGKEIGDAMGKGMQQAISEVMKGYSDAISKVMTEAMGQFGTQFANQLASGMENAFSFDEEALSNAFKFNMTEKELGELMASLMNTSYANYDGNLQKMGYVDILNPSSISIYPINFESKDEIIKILDGYNEDMENTNQEDKVVRYTDIVGVLMSSVTDIVNAISYVLIAFVAISLVVSSIMIGVITYISVLERRKEIGILRAIGASKGNISGVFNAETFIIGLLAGLFGIGLSKLILIPGNYILHTLGSENINAILYLKPAVLLVILSIVLTLIGGLIPSRKAAKSDPVTALRTE